MGYGLFILATLIFFLIGYMLYENNQFGCGTMFYLVALVPLYCVAGTFVHDHSSYEAFSILEHCINGLFSFAALAFIVKALKDNSRYEKEEARRREEKSKKPIVINVNVTSTTVEQN